MNDLMRKRTAYWAQEPEAELAGNNYKGIVSRAPPDIHPHVVELVQGLYPKGGSVLDLATGEGALALRLKDAGYRVTASDYTRNFKLQGVPFVQADLNERFPFEPVDCIVASEIIEHLENPRHFLRECRRIAKSVIITTPNLNSPLCKAVWVVEGHHRMFAPRDYESMGHITPVSPQMLKECATECGFKVEMHSIGDTREDGTPKLNLLAWLISRIDRSPWPRGRSLIAVLTPSA